MESSSHAATCPDDGRLRAHHDAPDPAVAAHTGECPACARRLAELRVAAQVAARAIAGLDDHGGAVIDARAAWAARPGAAHGGRGWTRIPAAVAAGIVLLLVATLLVVTPTGRQAAANFLERFRAERFEVVTLDPEAPTAGFEALADLADVEVDDIDHVVVTDLDEAGDVAGFAPTPVTSLPDGAQAAESMASAPATVRITLRADRAPDLPAELDGARLVVSLPGSIVTTYAVGGDQLFVAEAGQLVAEAEGADLAAVRGYLLSRPEIPEDVAQQLLAIDDWATTVPVPVPVDSIAWRDTTAGGQPALMLEDPMGAGLLWQRDGRVHAVGGMGADIDELRRIADGVGG
ncbi:MAG TPA: hypothetical protein VK875_07765 [Euzebyales bacterium]|nr:hypothetical protein [Euzebyales bacterium]